MRVRFIAYVRRWNCRLVVRNETGPWASPRAGNLSVFSRQLTLASPCLASPRCHRPVGR